MINAVVKTFNVKTRRTACDLKQRLLLTVCTIHVLRSFINAMWHLVLSPFLVRKSESYRPEMSSLRQTKTDVSIVICEGICQMIPPVTRAERPKSRMHAGVRHAGMRNAVLKCCSAELMLSDSRTFLFGQICFAKSFDKKPLSACRGQCINWTAVWHETCHTAIIILHFVINYSLLLIRFPRSRPVAIFIRFWCCCEWRNFISINLKRLCCHE